MCVAQYRALCLQEVCLVSFIYCQVTMYQLATECKVKELNVTDLLVVTEYYIFCKLILQ